MSFLEKINNNNLSNTPTAYPDDSMNTQPNCVDIESLLFNPLKPIPKEPLTESRVFSKLEDFFSPSELITLRIKSPSEEFIDFKVRRMILKKDAPSLHDRIIGEELELNKPDGKPYSENAIAFVVLLMKELNGDIPASHCRSFEEKLASLNLSPSQKEGLLSEVLTLCAQYQFPAVNDKCLEYLENLKEINKQSYFSILLKTAEMLLEFYQLKNQQSDTSLYINFIEPISINDPLTRLIRYDHLCSCLDARLLMAKLLSEQNKIEEANKIIDDIIQKDVSKQVEFKEYLSHARCLINCFKKDPSKSNLVAIVDYLNKLLGIFPQNTTIYLLAGDLFILDQNQDKALAYYKKVLSIDSENAEAKAKKSAIEAPQKRKSSELDSEFEFEIVFENCLKKAKLTDNQPISMAKADKPSAETLIFPYLSNVNTTRTITIPWGMDRYTDFFKVTEKNLSTCSPQLKVILPNSENWKELSDDRFLWKKPDGSPFSFHAVAFMVLMIKEESGDIPKTIYPTFGSKVEALGLNDDQKREVLEEVLELSHRYGFLKAYEQIKNYISEQIVQSYQSAADYYSWITGLPEEWGIEKLWIEKMTLVAAHSHEQCLEMIELIQALYANAQKSENAALDTMKIIEIFKQIKSKLFNHSLIPIHFHYLTDCFNSDPNFNQFYFFIETLKCLRSKEAADKELKKIDNILKTKKPNEFEFQLALLLKINIAHKYFSLQKLRNIFKKYSLEYFSDELYFPLVQLFSSKDVERKELLNKKFEETPSSNCILAKAFIEYGNNKNIEALKLLESHLPSMTGNTRLNALLLISKIKFYHYVGKEKSQSEPFNMTKAMETETHLKELINSTTHAKFLKLAWGFLGDIYCHMAQHDQIQLEKLYEQASECYKNVLIFTQCERTLMKLCMLYNSLHQFDTAGTYFIQFFNHPKAKKTLDFVKTLNHSDGSLGAFIRMCSRLINFTFDHSKMIKFGITCKTSQSSPFFVF